MVFKVLSLYGPLPIGLQSNDKSVCLVLIPINRMQCLVSVEFK